MGGKATNFFGRFLLTGKKSKISAKSLTLACPTPRPEMLRAPPRADQTSLSSLLKHRVLFHCWCCHFNFSLVSGSHAWGHLLVLTLPSGGS